ncbi:hypothetical protein CEXT_87401 [Caerostris extrusa]|uniref:Uncharacterized protein n=1 Tax=Caerostris extrusa TaxID=172846 RepID=A0AAV4QQZ4_CAEEX|nr:hypothetical protein CEXT_87401 [Caerostris extrusa]
MEVSLPTIEEEVEVGKGEDHTQRADKVLRKYFRVLVDFRLSPGESSVTMYDTVLNILKFHFVQRDYVEDIQLNTAISNDFMALEYP